MSRIAKKPLELEEGVTITKEDLRVLVKGPKGELKIPVAPEFSFKQEGSKVFFLIDEDSKNKKNKKKKALLGLYASLIKTAAKGVAEAFEVELELVGIGYKAQIQNQKLILNVGYSNPVSVEIPANLTVSCPNPTTISIVSIDKPIATAWAARVRKVRPPEVYKGKGIRYSGEIIKLKAGKTGK